MIAIITFIMDCFSFVFGLIKKPVSMMTKEYISKKNNVNIFITGYSDSNPFSLDTKKSSKIDFGLWHEKMKSGGKIIIKLGYVNETKKYLKKNNISDERRKELYDGIRRIEKTGKIMELVINKSLLEECVSDKIQNFPLFIESVASKCFGSLRDNKNSRNISHNYATRLLAVGNGKDSFKFYISKDEYCNVVNKSEGAIECPQFLYFNEFMNYINDKSILESEIIPTYLKILAIRENDQNKEFPCADFSNWWISAD